MKTLTRLALALLLAAATTTGFAAVTASTGELLQKGLYAEEVEGNLDLAIETYGQVIKNSPAPPNHVAQALYRQGMCYLKLKDEASARAVLEKLVLEFSGQTEIVAKARPMLDELTDFDPAALMPPGTLAYLEFGSPGRQVETALSTLKGTPFENPLAAVAGARTSNQRSPGDLLAALLNPSMMAEFKKIRSSAIGITGLTQQHPNMISVLYPGKSDALRGLILAGLGMVGTPAEPIEGMQILNLPEDMAVAYDDRVVIAARPAAQLVWCVKQYKGRISEPTLASSIKSFANLSKAQRQNNALTLWADVGAAYRHVLKLFPDGQVPQGLVSANAFVDFENIEDFEFTESLSTNGIATRLGFRLKEGNRCLAYDLIRTAPIDKTSLQAVPAEAIALASFSLSRTDSPAINMIEQRLRGASGVELGQGTLANLQQITLFAMPAEGGPAGSVTRPFLPASLGLAVTSRNPEQTRQVLAALLSRANPASPPPSNAVPARFKLGSDGQRDIDCHLDQVNTTTLLSLNRGIIDAAIDSAKNRRSVCDSGLLQGAVGGIDAATSKLLLVNVSGAIRALAPLLNRGTPDNEETRPLTAGLEQLARTMNATTIELRTEEASGSFFINTSLTGIPPLNELVGPAMQIAGYINSARARAAVSSPEPEIAATILPATRAPVIDGKWDESWSAARTYRLAKVSYDRPASTNDLAAGYRALWDENYLYVLVDVTDDNLRHDSTTDKWYESDSVEIYIDGDNAKAAQYGRNDFQYSFSWDRTSPSVQETKHNNTAGVQFAMVTADAGYRLEVRFPWSTLGVKSAAGAKIGLDVHVNDSDTAGKRDTKLAWRDRSDNAWQSPKAFGTAELAGLIGWWKFDETQGTSAADSSGGNHTGTLVGRAKWGKGRIGGAIDLDGAGSFVRIADKAAFDIGGEATVAAWVYLRSVPAEWTAVVAKGDSAWRLSTVQQEKKFHFAVDDYARSGDAAKVNGSQSVNAGEWHHVAGVYDGGRLNLYIDGRREESSPWAGAIGHNDFEVLIGENSERKNRCFDGLIDDVRMYNYALTEAGIKALAASR